MVWGYLSEFWNSVSSSTINAWEYSQEWFWNIGNAVAGAVGNLFSFINHYFSDFLVFISWLSHNLYVIFFQLTAPLRYIFVYSSSAYDNAFSPPVIPEDLGSFNSSTVSFFHSLPYWSTIQIAIVIFILFIGLVAILKLFLKS